MAFFATSHGKGFIDGAGGLVKRKVAERVIQRKAIVKDAHLFSECCVRNLNISVTFYFASCRDIERFNLNELGSTSEDVPELKGIKGAQHLYFFDGTILMKPYSSSPSEASITTNSIISIECNSKSFQKKAIKVSECVKILFEPYKGYYAIVISQSYGDEWKIRYFTKSLDKYEMKIYFQSLFLNKDLKIH